MLCTSAFILCLVCFLHSFGPLQCRRTGQSHAMEYSQSRSSLTRRRCFWSCFLETSRRWTCFEKCLGRNKEGDFNSNNTIFRIIPHLTTLSRRQKRNINEKNSVQCPPKPIGNDVFPSLRNPERKQYENSDKWYLNISWDPINDTTNFTGYGLAYWCILDEDNEVNGWITRQKNETFVVFNESESCWNYDRKLLYNVIALPCLNATFDFIELPWHSNLTTSSGPELSTPPWYSNLTTTSGTELSTPPWYSNLTTTSGTVSETPTVPTPNKVSIIASTVAIVAVLTAISITAYVLYRKKQRSHCDISRGDADYDAFIIFARDDQKWVDETLLSILEKECNYKCCVHYRDFIVGKDFVENMVDSVYTSRKVVAVMSKSFFSSKWCNFELRKAIYKHLNDGVIVIRIDDVSTTKLPKAIKKRSFIDYSNVIERQFFKTRLLKVLENSNNDDG